MKFIHCLLLVAITLLGMNSVIAQKIEPRMYWKYSTKGKQLVVDGKTYKSVSPSIFVAETDTLFKMQHPRKGAPVSLEGYQLIGSIVEPLAFKNSECTSKQIVDIYRKRPTPKPSFTFPPPEIIRFRDSIYCTDSLYIDTGSVKYVMPIDTGGLWVTLYPDLELEKYISTGSRAHGVFKVGTEAVLWNGKKAPAVIVVPNKSGPTKVDSINTVSQKDSLQIANDANANTPDESVLLRNVRIVAVNEIGLEKAGRTYSVSEDTCFICLEEENLLRLIAETAVAVQIAPKRPLGDEQLQVSVVLEARYRYLGKVTEVPNPNGWNRLSLGVAIRADYGPFAFQVRPKWTPGLGIGWTAGVSYNLFKWSPKKESRVSKLRLPTIKL